LRTQHLRMLAILLAISFMAIPIDAVEIRSSVAADWFKNGSFYWTADDFAGLYYDIDNDIKTEELATHAWDGKLMEPDGVTYTTMAMADDFEFEDWGKYNVIGFMGEKYFAGYLDTADSTDDILFEESNDENPMSDEQLLRILMDRDMETIIMSGVPLKLAEGYELAIKYIDNSGMFLELTKNGEIVDSKILSPSKAYAGMADKTYYYRKDIGETNGLITIAVHFKNALTIGNQTMATVDGLWQLSDVPVDVSENTEYDKMTIQSVTADSISMNNEDNVITLGRNKEILLMPGVSIKTADSDDLRYYLYKEITEPGTYEIRGKVATEGATWTADDFAGFYFDLDDDIKTEELSTVVTDNKLAEPDGVTYTTTAMADDFEFVDWGQYSVIGFMAEKYFAGYVDTADSTDDILFEKSEDENALSDEQLMRILMDSDNEAIIIPGAPLRLAEGYELTIKYIDSNGMFLELTKNGEIIDSKILSPSNAYATMADKTYCYKKDIGDSKDVVILAVHFKNALTIGNQTMATIDGIWQLSDIPVDVSENTEYDKMTIQSVTADSITMNNEDNDIALSKNKEISLMPRISIKTADSDELRYYIFTEERFE
jgi:S-layer protein (TIGR01567 family)